MLLGALGDSALPWNTVTNLPCLGNPIAVELTPTNPAAFYRVEVSLPKSHP